MAEPVVRVMTADDDLVELGRGNPFAWQAELWEAMTASAPDYPYVRLAGLLGERPVGFALGTSGPVSAGGLGAGMVFVQREHRRRGVGTALWQALRAALRDDCPGVQLAWTDRDAAGAPAADAWGLRAVATHVESVLELDAVAPGAHPPPTGVALRLLADDADEADWRAVHAFLEDRLREAPDSADGGGDLPYDVFRGAVPEPWQVLLAERDSRAVGITCVCSRGADDVANTFFTGVAPEARQQGLAVALKSRHAALLRERGVRRLYTQNMVGNAPILAANARLGFRRDAAYTDVVERWGRPA